MDNNLLLALDIADAAAAKPESERTASAAALVLVACHPEADATYFEIVAAIRDQDCIEIDPDVWFVD